MRTGTVFQKYKLHHVIGWVLVGLVWYCLRYDDFSTNARAVTVTFIKTIDLALMVYVANYLLVPHFLYRKKYIYFSVLYILMIAVSSIYKMYLIGQVTHNAALILWTDDIRSRIYDNMLPHFFLVTAGVALKLLFDQLSMQRRMSELAREKAEAELNFLKSQINPHFLFNSLNSVYFLIDKKNTEARAALHKFSDMLRYQLYEMNGEQIPIEKEIGYLRDYIGLESLRSEHCSVLFRVPDDLPSFRIEPLLLVPLVENSFKHVSHYSEKPNEIIIDLSKQNGTMNFSVRNTTEGKPAAAGQPGGIGLANVRRRLELLYPKQYRLDVSEQEGWFQVQLDIKMDH